MANKLLANAGAKNVVQSLVGLTPGGVSIPLWYCLAYPIDRGASQATVHRVANSRIRMLWFSIHTYDNQQNSDKNFWLVKAEFVVIRSPVIFDENVIHLRRETEDISLLYWTYSNIFGLLFEPEM